MKKIFVLFMISVLVVPLFAQDIKIAESAEKNVMKINTISLLVLAPSIFYERELSDNLSGQLGVGYLNYNINDTKFKGVILTPEARFYLRKNAIDGFYLGPYFRYQNFSLEAGTGKASYTNYGGGLSFGRQWILNSGFTLDLFFGGHYGSGQLDIESGTADQFDTNKFDGFRTRVGFALGFAF
jgi:hypothetical protein